MASTPKVARAVIDRNRGEAQVEDRVVATFPMERANPFDPPPGYVDMQAEGPIVRARMTTARKQDVWLVTRYEEARAVLRDTRFSSDCLRPGFPLVREPSALIRMDPPTHTHYRRMLAPEFVGRHIAGLRGEIESLTDRLLDEMEAEGPPADLVRTVAMPLPSLVICRLLGVPLDDHAFLQEQTAIALCKTSSDENVDDAVQALGDYMERIVRAKEADPDDDLLSRLVVDHVRTGTCSHEVAVDLARLLLVAGHVTTVNMIGLGVLTLLLHPEQADALRRSPSLVEGCVEELLRHHSITGAIARVATEDAEIGGQLVRAGDGVLVLLSVANRDPREYLEPDRFDLHRPVRQHLAFGYGPHHCLGSALARLELQVVLGRILARFPQLRLAVPVADVQFRHEMRIYGVHELPVAW